MAEFLLELYSEEIPHGLQISAREEIKQNLLKSLEEESINCESAEVYSTPVSTVIIQGQGSAYVAQHGQSLVSTQLSLERLKKSPWLRVTVIDHNGKRAWSNPIWRT